MIRPIEESRFLAHRILERASQECSQVEVFLVDAENSPVHFEANAVKGMDSSESSGAALRVIVDGRVGFSSTTNLNDIDGLIEAALETAPFGAQAHFEFPEASKYPEIVLSDPETDSVSLEEMTALGQKIIEEVRSESSDAQVEGTVSKSRSAVTIVNSRGANAGYSRTRFGFGFEGTVIRGEDMLFTSDGISAIGPITDPMPVTSSIIRQLAWARQTVPMEGGNMPAILMPTAVPSILLGPLLAGLNGKSVYQGTSPLVGRLGERIVDERFSLTDDPIANAVPGSRPCDDEGIPSRQLPLIDSGYVANFFYDLQTAGLAQTTSTGSGERGLSSLPGPSTGVLMVGEGEGSLDDLIAFMKNGIIVERLLGAGQGNVLGGDFNANILLGYRVENGHVVGRVKDVMVAGNAYDALNSLVTVGGDGRWLGGGLYTPPIVLSQVAVSAKV